MRFRRIDHNLFHKTCAEISYSTAVRMIKDSASVLSFSSARAAETAAETIPAGDRRWTRQCETHVRRRCPKYGQGSASSLKSRAYAVPSALAHIVFHSFCAYQADRDDQSPRPGIGRTVA